jgi:hypothetical protein
MFRSLLRHHQSRFAKATETIWLLLLLLLLLLLFNATEFSLGGSSSYTSNK